MLNFDTNKATDGKELPHDFWGNFRISLKARCFLKYASLTPNGRPYPRSECLNPYLAFSFWWLCRFNVASTLPYCSPRVTQQDKADDTHTRSKLFLTCNWQLYTDNIYRYTCDKGRHENRENVSAKALRAASKSSVFNSRSGISKYYQSRQLSHKDWF